LATPDSGTPKGAYFAVHLSCWDGERSNIEPLATDEAISMYEGMTEQREEYEDAFPGVEIEEA
jgi:hypothetical protein